MAGSGTSLRTIGSPKRSKTIAFIFEKNLQKFDDRFSFRPWIYSFNNPALLMISRTTFRFSSR
jgi:hypothetical protein